MRGWISWARDLRFVNLRALSRVRDDNAVSCLRKNNERMGTFWRSGKSNS
jgi:hypothetical protein